MAEAKAETKAEAKTETKTETAVKESATSRRGLSAVAALMVGLAVGASVGIVAGGALLAAVRSAPSAGPAAGFHDEGVSPRPVLTSVEAVHTIDALVVNPADTEATRFLMATLVVVADRQAVVDQLKERDAEAREVVLRALGSKTVAELSDLAKRDELKEELRQALLGVVDAGRILRIHLPQFVIQ